MPGRSAPSAFSTSIRIGIVRELVSTWLPTSVTVPATSRPGSAAKRHARGGARHDADRVALERVHGRARAARDRRSGTARGRARWSGPCTMLRSSTVPGDRRAQREARADAPAARLLVADAERRERAARRAQLGVGGGGLRLGLVQLAARRRSARRRARACARARCARAARARAPPRTRRAPGRARGSRARRAARPARDRSPGDASTSTTRAASAVPDLGVGVLVHAHLAEHRHALAARRAPRRARS